MNAARTLARLERFREHWGFDDEQLAARFGLRPAAISQCRAENAHLWSCSVLKIDLILNGVSPSALRETVVPPISPERVKSIREGLGLSYDDFGRLLGIDGKEVRYVERGGGRLKAVFRYVVHDLARRASL